MKVMSNKDKYEMHIDEDGSITFRKPFRGGTIAMQRLLFSSSNGVVFCINAERISYAIIYE